MGNLFGSPEDQNKPTRRSRIVTSQENYTLRNELFEIVSPREYRTTPVLNSPTRQSYTTHRLENNAGTSNNGISNYRTQRVEVANTNISRKRNELSKIESVKRSSALFVLEYISSHAQELNWDERNYAVSAVYFIELDNFSAEYEKVKQLFRSTNKKSFQVTKIERIQNPFLLAAFLLKRKEMKNKTGSQHIEELFHGTKRENVQKICTDNFDWRLSGQSTGNIW